MLKLFIFIAFVAFAASEKVRYDDYKVLRIVPTTKEQVNLLKELQKSSKGYDFWKFPSFINHPADLMVSPSQLSEVTEFLKSNHFAYNIQIKNLQRLMDIEKPLTKNASTEFDFENYHTIEEIYEYLESIEKKYPEIVEVIEAGESYEGRLIKGVKLSFGSDDKPGVFIEAGIHAREWIAPATALYIINAFLTSKDPEIYALARNYTWYIVPSVNPDGYAYTHEYDRLWRKTRSPTSIKGCEGADPNRNWDYQWNVVGATDFPCSETYAGSKAFSEIEMKTLSDYIASVKDEIFTYISFHSYSQLLLFPYGHTPEHLENYEDLYYIAEKSTRALKKMYGTHYVFGNIAEAIYPASGNSIDYAKAVLKIPIAFTYEFRDTGYYGFELPSEYIKPNSEEVIASLIAMFKAATELGYPQKYQ